MSGDLAGIYTDAIHNGLKQYASWPIGSLVQLGDYGTLEGTRFKRIGNISHELVKAQCKVIQSPVQLVFNFSSVGVQKSNLNVGASGSAGSPQVSASAAVRLKFAKSDSVFFRSIRLVYGRLDNFAEVSAAVMKKFREGSWPGSYVFVSEVFTSGGTTVIISNSDNAEIDIQAGAKGLQQFDLADVNAQLSVTHDLNVGLQVIANQLGDQKQDNLVPLFSLAKVRPRFRWLPFLGGRTVRTMLADHAAPDTSSPPIGTLPGERLVTLNPEITPDIATSVGKDVDEVFQVEQLP